MRYITIILIWFFISCSQKTNDKEIKVNINGDIYDFGKIIQSDTLRTKFRLRNDLDTNIEIEKLSGSSKQIQVTSNKRILKPKEIAIINVEFFTKELNGAQKRQITIKTSNKEKPYTNYYIKAIVQKINSHKKERFFDQIINKKETAEKLINEFSYDSIISFSKEEKLRYKEIGLNDGYYLTNFRFLKRPIDSIDFSIYYKISFGDQLEKILRVKRKDTIFDMTLALKGGDGGDTWYTRTEFINDSIFIKTSTYKQTAIENPHLMAYATDSIITKYYYDENLNFKEIKKDSFHIYKKYPTFNKNLKGKTFKTFSDIFSINGMKCHWEYEVEYTDETNENSKEYIVNIISQKLMKFSPREYILDLDLSKFAFRTKKNITDLESTDYFYVTNDKIKDINFDGYDDFEFHNNVSGANQNYTVYLFNPNLKKFEYSKDLSGASLGEGIELDKNKKIAIYSGKGGGGIYGFRKVHFNSDGSIKYKERFWNEEIGDYSSEGIKYSFNYKKEKDGVITDSLKVFKRLKNEGLQSIYYPFFEWIESFEE